MRSAAEKTTERGLATKMADAGAFAVVFVTILLASIALVFSISSVVSPAYANMYTESEAAAAFDEPSGSDESVEEGAVEEGGDEGEPVASDQGDAEQASSTNTGLQIATVVGIVAVVVFFVVSVYRLNHNISNMKGRFR